MNLPAGLHASALFLVYVTACTQHVNTHTLLSHTVLVSSRNVEQSYVVALALSATCCVAIKHHIADPNTAARVFYFDHVVCGIIQPLLIWCISATAMTGC